MRTIRVLLSFLLGLGGIAAAAASQPGEPIRLIVSTSPGGGADLTVRLIAPRLSERLGQTVIVENRPGASGMIAGAYVAKQPADGHTFLVDIATFPVNPVLQPKMVYDPFEDLVPVTQNIRAANVLVVPNSSPARSLAEFIDLARSRNGALTFATAGNGSAQHLAMEIFKRAVGIEMVNVPYKGGGPAMTDTIAGHVDAYFGFLPSVTPHIREGRLRPLATTGEVREKSLPEIPTFIESGVQGFTAYDWNGVFAPAGTAPEIVARMQREISAVLHLPEVVARLNELGTEPVGNSPDEFRAFLVAERDKWGRIVEQANIKVEQ